MSDSSTSPGRGGNRNPKRNLPSWMSSRQNVSDHARKKRASGGAPDESDEAEKPKQDKGGGKTNSKENQRSRQSSASTSGATKFSKLLEGVVFVLSGFVNPERSVLRSQALEMGAEYQADWNSNCTLLVCAFPNTPKFRQVESDCGTIVSKEWISECYNEKKLVDIELYLMHTGKPWRKQNKSHEPIQDQELTASKKSHKHAEKSAYSNTTSMASSKGLACSSSDYHFPPSKVKKWAAEDFTKTIAWLESQDEMPHPSEIKNIAAEGILTCLQDAIDSLKQEQEIQHISEQWNFVPRVIEELAKLEGSGDGSHSLPKKYLYKQAISCKEIYEKELDKLHDSSDGNKKMKTGEKEVRGSAKCDSDETIEMTEEDIDQAYNTVTSTLC